MTAQTSPIPTLSGLGGIAAGLKSLFHLDKQPEAPAAPAPDRRPAVAPYRPGSRPSGDDTRSCGTATALGLFE